ncbi:MAG: S8 family serine peptidase, partial [Pseudomonadota bacterium]
VGVIDSGLGQHSALAHANNLGAIVNCQRDPKGGADARGHGTHVCGGIGGRPLQSTEFGGTAPGVDLSALRVFGDDGSAHQADIALALYVMAHEQGCHLVNLSLGTTQRSDLVADAISDARQAGCLTLCATGNGDDAVEYPAALDDSVAVGAVGIDGWGPVGSLAASRKPDDPARMATPWFIGKFSSHGPEVNAVAAGVGIIATVPGDQYAGYSGTSMAAPQLTALLAAALGGHTALNESGSARSEAMLRVLQQHLTDMGLSSDLQGQGRMVVG